MIEQISRVYNLKRIELAILFALKGVKELYGFKLEIPEHIEQQQINKALFEMSQKEILSIQNEKVKIHPEIETMLNYIGAAKRVLICSGRTDQYPEQCIYLANETVRIQIMGHSRDMIRMEQISKTNLPEYIMRVGFQLEQVIMDELIYEERESDNSEIACVSQNLFNKNKDEIWKCKETAACLFTISLETRQKEMQILLLNKGIEDYITLSNGEINYVYVYSRKKLAELIEHCIKGECK